MHLFWARGPGCGPAALSSGLWVAVWAVLAVSVLRRGPALWSSGKVLISRHAVGPAETLPQECLIP